MKEKEKVGISSSFISEEDEKENNNEALQSKNIENLFTFAPKSPSMNSILSPNFPAMSSTLPPPSPAISSTLPPTSPAMISTLLPFSPALTSLNQNSSSLFKEMDTSTNSSSTPVNSSNSSIDASFGSSKPPHLNNSFVLTPPFSPSRNQEKMEPTSDNFVSFQLDEKETSPIIVKKEEEEKEEHQFLINTDRKRRNVQKYDDEDEEYKPPDGIEQEEEEEEEKFVEKMVEEELEIQRGVIEDEIDFNELTPSEENMEKEDDKFTFHEDNESLLEDPSGMEFNQFMTSKEAYRKENPMHAYLVPQNGNNTNPWTIHNKMKEEVERQRHLIESLRIRQIQEEELAFARAQSARNNSMEEDEEMEDKEDEEDEEMEDVKKSNSSKDKNDNSDDKSFEEGDIDYSQWTIGTRADVLDGSPIPKKESFTPKTNLNIYAFNKEFVEEEKKGHKNMKKNNKIKQKKKKQSQKKKKKQASKKKNDKKTKKKKSINKKIKQNIDTNKPEKRKRKIQVRKVQDYMGVYTRGNGRFFCTARIEGKQKYIGSYPIPKEAALEYDKFVFAYRGENYVSYNFPELLGLDENKAYKK